jgi:MFS family permease
VPYAKAIQIDADKAVTIMSFIGLGSIIGRIAMGGLSDRIGIKNSLLIALGIMVLSFFWLLSSAVLWKLYLFSVFFGFAYGAMIALETLAGAKMFGLLSLGSIAGAFGFDYSLGGSLVR